VLEQPPEDVRIAYRAVSVDGVNIAYREAGPGDAPVILLLHPIPGSSRTFEPLIRRLGGRYRLVALDYPGFGRSDAPDPERFRYAYEPLARTVAAFVDQLGLTRFALYLHGSGVSVGMRLALARPQALEALIVQNGTIYEDGLRSGWTRCRSFWRDRDAHEADMLSTHLSPSASRRRRVGRDPDLESYDPEIWEAEAAFLKRPRQAEIQLDLLFDEQTNLQAFPGWQAWLRARRPPLLVLWGRHDLAFNPATAVAFQRDAPEAEVRRLEAGYFASDTHPEQVAWLVNRFLQRLEAPLAARNPDLRARRAP
jgi:pimeloyl-ACP methyl ester carboxylesterase